MARKTVAAVSPISVPTTPPVPPLRSRHALRVPEAAAYAGTTPFFIECATRDGSLPFREISLRDGTVSGGGRLYSTEDLDAWVESMPKQRVVEIKNGKAVTEKAA